jgi:hypothetical protein
MAVLEDIAADRQRIADRLARVEAERTKLVEQLAELDAAERVLSRISPSTGVPRRGRRARTEAAVPAEAAPGRRGRRARQPEATAPAAPARRREAGRRGRKPRAKAAMPLGDAALQAVAALGNNVLAEQVLEYLGRELSMQVRPNHLGMALVRHRRAGRLQEDDGRWSVQGSGEVEAER